MMLNTNRQNDMDGEQKLARFMDKYFYSKLHGTNGEKYFFERKRDWESQMKGIDICLSVGDKEFLIDEKATLYYSNAMIPTFAFEINSLQGNQDNLIEGWFINDDLLTEYYMLIWPNIKCEKRESDNTWIRKNIKNIKESDFTIVEAMLIEKQKLKDSIFVEGYDRDRLLAYAKKMRELYEGSTRMEEEKICNDIKITFSNQIPEKPVNIVVGKDRLKRLSSAIYLISEDGYASIK